MFQSKTVLSRGFKTNKNKQGKTKKVCSRLKFKTFYESKLAKVAEQSPASKEQRHLHQGLQWPEGGGFSGAVMYLYLFSFSRMATGTPGLGWCR